jgi:galactose mutarotase-like enzyme
VVAITREQRQYETYILTDPQAEAQAEIVPERGGILTRWQLQGQELLYLDAERFAQPELTVRGGIPILFPICGNLPDDTYTYGNQSYRLKQHGFARDLPWQVTEQRTGNGAALTLSLTSNERTRAVYPFEFQMDFTYRLHHTTLSIEQRYLNRSAVAMPFSTGLHPYFQVNDKTQLRFDIPATQLQDQRTQRVHPFTGGFNFDVDEIDVAFRDISQPSASVTDPERQLQMMIEFDPIYSTLVFWTVQGKAYYCLEPWTAPRNALNTGDHLITLEPGNELRTTVKLTARFL